MWLGAGPDPEGLWPCTPKPGAKSSGPRRELVLNDGGGMQLGGEGVSQRVKVCCKHTDVPEMAV